MDKQKAVRKEKEGAFVDLLNIEIKELQDSMKQKQIEELKAEASKLGYILVKKREYIPLLPCPCGAISKTKLIYSTDWSMFYRCSKCNFEGYRADTKYEARENWNKAVKNNG